jgi:hypothetical protein
MSEATLTQSQVQTDHGPYVVDDETAHHLQQATPFKGVDDQKLTEFENMTPEQRQAVLSKVEEPADNTDESEKPSEQPGNKDEENKKAGATKPSESGEEGTKDKARIRIGGLDDPLRKRSIALMQEDTTLSPAQAEAIAREQLGLPVDDTKPKEGAQEKSGDKPTDSGATEDGEIDFSADPDVQSIENDIAAKEKELEEAQEELDHVKISTLNRELGKLDHRLDAAKERVTRQHQEAIERHETARSDSQDRAIELYPDIADETSDLSQEINKIHQQYVKEGRAIVNDPEYPEHIAAKAAQALSIAPKSQKTQIKGGNTKTETDTEASGKSKPPFSPPVGGEGGDTSAASTQSLTAEQVIADIDGNDELAPHEKSELLTQALTAASQAELAKIRAMASR